MSLLETRPWDRSIPAERAEDSIEWCERYLFLPEGKHVGQRLQMAEFMKDDFRAIYGNPAGCDANGWPTDKLHSWND